MKSKKPKVYKPCKFCGSTFHFPYQCALNPKKRKRISTYGKKAKAFTDHRKYWIKRHPAPWVCYLQISPMCLRNLDEQTMTLDHIRPKGSNGELRHEDKNLKPACSPCNGLKGSRSLESLIKEGFAHLNKYV